MSWWGWVLVVVGGLLGLRWLFTPTPEPEPRPTVTPPRPAGFDPIIASEIDFSKIKQGVDYSGHQWYDTEYFKDIISKIDSWHEFFDSTFVINSPGITLGQSLLYSNEVYIKDFVLMYNVMKGIDEPTFFNAVSTKNSGFGALDKTKEKLLNKLRELDLTN